MTDTEFWAVIEKTISEDQEAQCDRLGQVLGALSKQDLIGFEQTYRSKLAQAYSWDLWAGAYIINGGCSDDGFDYFCDWLISKGESVFNAALKDPETLIGVAIPWETEFEEFRYVMMEVFEEKHDGSFPVPEASAPAAPAGDAWDEETVEDKYPKLAAWANA